jgi:hypothetical protein
MRFPTPSVRFFSLLTLGLLASSGFGSDTEPAFHLWAKTPPMGWNSWDYFGTTLTESQAKAQADYFATHLKSHGWEYLVVDIQWYEPGSAGHSYREGAPLTMDANGRLQPAPNKFPSSVNGAGFKPLADYVHSLGLKFGIHLMRGIPRLAVKANLPVHGTNFRAQDVANQASTCPWNPDMYGVDMTKPGAQAYYDSVFALIAAWGVDYVKVDDIARPYHQNEKEIEAIRTAIDHSGRPMVLSLSPGETALSAAAHVREHANLWRISDDFWDTWTSLQEQFARLDSWTPFRRPGAWPDADMLPLGVLNLGQRSTRFTRDEQYTVMSLWSIARSPLMHGGDMTKTDDFTLSLLTNDEVLGVNQHSENNRQLFSHDDLVAWTADVSGSPDKYLAVFNARGPVSLAPERAAFRSEVLTAATPGHGTDVDIALKGATRLMLYAEPGDHEGGDDHGLWIDPRVVLADGTERSLLDTPWTRAEAMWEHISTVNAPNGKPMSHNGKPVAHGIGVHAKALIEYALPAGAVRFRTRAALDDGALSASGHEGKVQMSVFIGGPGGDLAKTGLPVAVSLPELGFKGKVKIRNLWAHEDLGQFSATFAPQINWHGAGLYRVSAAP